MTDNLYLIAHKVRGEPAFDIAQHMTCPKCDATDDHCTACDGQGHWWIIPTSGHRAWPYWDAKLSDIDDTYDLSLGGASTLLEHPGPMPPSLRDHYTTEREASINLLGALGLDKPRPQPPLKRRF